MNNITEGSEFQIQTLYDCVGNLTTPSANDILEAYEEMLEDSEFAQEAGVLSDFMSAVVDQTGVDFEEFASEGCVFIRENRFPYYIRDTYEELTSENMNVWPYDHINWESAADEAKADYHEITVFGLPLLIRFV